MKHILLGTIHKLYRFRLASLLWSFTSKEKFYEWKLCNVTQLRGFVKVQFLVFSAVGLVSAVPLTLRPFTSHLKVVKHPTAHLNSFSQLWLSVSETWKMLPLQDVYGGRKHFKIVWCVNLIIKVNCFNLTQHLTTFLPRHNHCSHQIFAWLSKYCFRSLELTLWFLGN